MVRKKIRSLVEQVASQGQCASKLALTCSLGIFIGISPFVGAHTAMTFLLGWALRLNIPRLFAVSMLIHNPWTMVPIYSFDHFFGKWLFSFFNIDPMSLNPAWVASLNFFLERYTGISGLSLTAFLIGGNLLAISISVILYLPMKRVFTMYLSKKNNATR